MIVSPPGAEPAAAPRPALVRLPRQPVRATYVMLGAIGLVFLGQLVMAPFPGDVDPLLVFGAKVNELIVAGEWWRLITPIFVHGSLLHFFFNAYALYSLGREVERFYGAARFTLVFFFAGVAGTTASLWLSPAPSVGASGAIFGLIGAEAVLLYRNRALLGERARAGLQNILLIAAVNLVIGFQGGMRIDNWAHLGGLAGGLAMAWAVGPLWRLSPAPFVTPAGGLAYDLVDQQPLDGARVGVVLFLLAALGGLIGVAIVFQS